MSNNVNLAGLFQADALGAMRCAVGSMDNPWMKDGDAKGQAGNVTAVFTKDDNSDAGTWHVLVRVPDLDRAPGFFADMLIFQAHVPSVRAFPAMGG